MTRRFTLGSVTDRKIVVIELQGTRMSVVRVMPDGSMKRQEQELGSEAKAQSASEQMARELVSRGFVEQVDRSARPAKPAPEAAVVARDVDDLDPEHLFDDARGAAVTTAPVLSRGPGTPIANQRTDGAPKKKKKTRGKKKAASGDVLDKRVLAGIAGVGAVFLCFLGYVVYDMFLKPASIIGTWRGSMLEHEISRRLSHTRYDLILDEQRHASLTLQEKYTTVGTYSVKGNRLKLNLKDEDGNPSEHEYKISLGRVTLDLIDPDTNKLVVELIRFRETPAVQGKTSPVPAPPELGAIDPAKVDKAADERLASVDYTPKDRAFKLRYPRGWEAETGSRPDNTYSWATLSHDSAKIQVHADVKGSLMSGSDSSRDHEEGSESAPVHVAHELYKKTASEEFTDYKESKAVLFKGSQLGEGRIGVFTASGGGLLGSRIRGYHVTLLTNDRRVSVLCQCPEKEFATLKPTFLAVCRSLSRP